MEIPVGMKRVGNCWWSRVGGLRRTVLCLLLFFGYNSTATAQVDLYQRYSAQEGVMVACVSGFPIDSLSRIDVTVVEATSDQGWDWMRREFRIADLMPEQQADLRVGSDVVLFARRNRNNPGEGVPVVGDSIDLAASCYVGISYIQRAVYIFCPESEQQSDAIVTLLVKKIMHSGSNR